MSRALGIGAGLAAVALALLPVLGTPHVSDDVINYSFGWLASADFARATLEEIRHWMLSSGRIFVLSTYLKNTTFQAFETIAAYKVFLVAMNVACVAIFCAYARMLTRSWVVPVAAALVFPVLLQLRDYHDPVVSFNGLFQVCAGLTFAALAFHLRFLRGEGRCWLYAALAAFVVNLFAYEMAVLTLAFAWLQQRLEPGRSTRAAVVPFVLALAAYGVVAAASRWLGATVYGASGSIYGLGLAPGAVAATFAKQALATLPFTYALLRPADGNWSVAAPPQPVPWLGSWEFLVALPVFAMLAWAGLRAAWRADAMPGASRPGPMTSSWAMAAALVVLPAAMISVVSRYQGAFAPGNGYSPVYLQMFGLALAAGLAARSIAARRWAPAALAAVVGIASAGNLVNNAAVAASLTRAWAPQYSWGAALRSGDMRQACSGVVAPVVARPWNEYRVVGNAGLRFAEPGAVAGASGCLVRDAVVLGRPAVAWLPMRDGAPAGNAGVVIPLADGESRDRLAFGTCEGAPAPAVRTAQWTHAGRRFALFTLDAAAFAPVAGPWRFRLPCERME